MGYIRLGNILVMSRNTSTYTPDHSLKYHNKVESNIVLERECR